MRRDAKPAALKGGIPTLRFARWLLFIPCTAAILLYQCIRTKKIVLHQFLLSYLFNRARSDTPCESTLACHPIVHMPQLSASERQLASNMLRKKVTPTVALKRLNAVWRKQKKKQAELEKTAFHLLCKSQAWLLRKICRIFVRRNRVCLEIYEDSQLYDFVFKDSYKKTNITNHKHCSNMRCAQNL